MQPKKFSELDLITSADGSEIIPILKNGENKAVTAENLPISNETQAALDATDTGLSTHVADTDNPHQVTKTQVGLGNADNTSDVNKPVSTATQAALDTKATNTALSDHTSDTDNPHQVTKAQVGLGNADNTSDANKPVSNAAQTAINLKADITYVDAQDELKADQATTYNKTEVDSKDTAVAAAAQTNLDAHATNTSNPHATTKAQVGLGNVDNTTDANKPVSSATQSALNLKANISSLAPVATSGDHGALTGLADDDHPQYLNEARGDARYVSAPFATMAKATFANLISEYGLLGQTSNNTGYSNDLVVYGQSTQAGTPTPDVPVPIVSTTGNVTVRSDSKNLIYIARPTTTYSGVTFTVNADGSITANGTATANAIFQTDSLGARTIRIVAGVPYTVQGILGGSASTYYTEVETLNDDGTVTYINAVATTLTATPVKSGWARAYVTVRSGYTANNLVFRPQLEVGSTATAFEKNTSTTQTLPLSTTRLRSLPNGVSDRIYRSGGSWFLEQNVAKITTDGVGRYGTYGLNFSGHNRLQIYAGTLVTASGAMSSATASQMSNLATVDTLAYNFGTPGEFLLDRSTSELYLTFSSSTTESQAKALLVANPIEVTYQLATPITTPITDQTLITALENIRTYQGITNITASTPISGSYGLDLTGMLNAATTNKLDKALPGVASLYSVSSAGVQSTVRYAESIINSSVPLRDAAGRIQASSPINANEVTNKSFVDDRILKGSGAPNGLVAATVGTLYSDTAVTNGASLWVKKSGTGNTGWQVLEGDTGWRDISSSISNGWTGTLLMRRINNDIVIHFEALNPAVATNGSIVTLQVGFRPAVAPTAGNLLRMFLSTASGPAQVWRITLNSGGGCVIQNFATTTGLLYGTLVAPTETTWPTTLPGTAA